MASSARRRPRPAAARRRRLHFDFLESRRLLAAAPELLADLNLDTRPSWPDAITSVNGLTYFTAFQGVCRSGCDSDIQQVWRTDGTDAGTRLLAEFSVPSPNLAIDNFTASGGYTYFIAKADLWRTDGTPEGTVKVKDFTAFPPPTNLVDVNGTLFFAADEGLTGMELWKSDGTPNGTVMVKEIESGAFGSAPGYLTNLNGTLFFIASDTYRVGARDFELWKSDGTAAGTVVVRDIIPGATGSQPGHLVALGGKLLFFATDGVNGKELWSTDGSVAGTQLVQDMTPGASSSGVTLTGKSGGLVYFRKANATTGPLWQSDGTDAGTRAVVDATGKTFAVDEFVDVGGTLFFNVPNDGIWKTNGTAAGTVKVTGTGVRLAAAGGRLFFVTRSVTEDKLWTSDGTAAGTVTLATFANPIAQNATLVGSGNRVYFDVDDGVHGNELWSSNGTVAGTALVKDFNAITNDSTRIQFGTEVQFTEFQRQAFFTAYSGNGLQGQELWRSDGTTSGTAIVVDSHPGAGSTIPDNLTLLPQGILYAGTTPSLGRELFFSDGTAAGTGLLKDIRTGVITGSPASGSPNFITTFGNSAYFAASGDHASISANDWLGIELWKSDGTAAGTTLVKDINTGNSSSNPRRFTPVGNRLFFMASASGTELWVTDGTSAGTNLVKDIYPGTGGYGPGFMTAVGNTLFFAADDSVTGTELWKSDGTAAGTVLVKDIRPSSTGSIAIQIENAVNQVGMNWVNLGGILYFIADDGTNGEELWRSDGTAAGTFLVKDIATGSAASSPRYLTVFENKLIFTATTTGSGREVWVSDGTAAGTTQVKEIFPGNTGSEPAYLAKIHDAVYFSANDGVAGYELWKTNGTAAGTVLAGDLRPGPAGSDPSEFAFVDGTMYFTADDGVTGFEPWKLDLVPVLDVTFSSPSIAENSGVHATLGTVNRRKAADISTPLVVTLATSDASEAVPAATVTIPANQTSVAFSITAVDDNLLDGTQTVRITATATGFADGAADLQVTDMETLSLTFDKGSIREDQGTNAAIGTITRSNTDTALPLVVTIGGSDASEATAPATVTIPANATSVTFSLQAIDDSLLDGSQTVNWTASASGYQSASALITVTDHETLSVSISPGSVTETAGAAAALVTVTRNNTDRSAALVVSLTSSDTTEATVPTTITILAGQASASVSLGAVDDTLLDGPQSVTITAAAAGYVDGAATISVTDVESLALSLDVTTFAENAGSSAATATVTRGNSDLTQPLTVTLTSSDTSEVVLPASVTIPAQQSSVTFAVSAIDDTLRDGSQAVTLTAAVAGYVSATAQATVTDVETLVITLASPSIAENAGNAATTGTITRSNTDRSLALSVTLTVSDSSEARVPATVTIPANQASVTFAIDALDDTLLDGPQSVTITPAATGYFASGASLTLTDVESLTLSVSPSTFAENAGTGAATATVTRSNTDRSQSLTVTIVNPDPSEVTMATTVVIPANQAGVTFPLDAVDDNLLDGSQTFTLQVSADGYQNGTRAITVTDHETLQLELSPSTIGENGGTATGRITRNNADAAIALVVSLTSGDTSEAVVPASVTIPAGETSATFLVTGVDDNLLDGSQSVTITANAAGYAGTNQTLTVTDFESLVVTITNPTLSERNGITTGTVSRSNADRSQPLIVDLVVGDSSEASVPATVTIPANQTSATFSITGVDDTLLDGAVSVSVTASASGYVDGTANFSVTDQESLSLTFDTNTASENGGVATATVTRSNTDNASPLLVTLNNSDTSEVKIPESVIIPANASSVSFTVEGVDDDLLDSVQLVTLRALADNYEMAFGFFLVTDWETLTFEIPTTPLIETGPSVMATVTRGNTDLSQPLVVTLSSDDSTQLRVPATVTIPANAASATFALTAPYDDNDDGTISTVIHGSADGYQSTTAAVSSDSWAFPWSNVINPLDVSRDNDLTPLDALEVINDLNERGARLLPPPSNPLPSPPFLDVSRDWQVTPLDALLVINALNEMPAAEGEFASTGDRNSDELSQSLPIGTASIFVWLASTARYSMVSTVETHAVNTFKGATLFDNDEADPATLPMTTANINVPASRHFELPSDDSRTNHPALGTDDSGIASLIDILASDRMRFNRKFRDERIV